MKNLQHYLKLNKKKDGEKPSFFILKSKIIYIHYDNKNI